MHCTKETRKLEMTAICCVCGIWESNLYVSYMQYLCAVEPLYKGHSECETPL